MGKFVIDRFEEQYVICENMKTSEMINIPKREVDMDAKPGNILAFIGGKYMIDRQASREARDRIIKKRDNLWGK